MAKEPEDKRKIKRIPSLKNYGGVRTIQKTLERSATLEANREAVSYALLTMANTNLTDIMSWDEDGNIKVKASKDIPEHALQAIKSIKSTTRYDKEGNPTATLDIELFDKIGVLRLLAKASGLLDQQQESDKPSVIGVNIVAPEPIDVEVEDGED
tara:strand:+ start:1133 stop:1597 length:465 start_codon:yes stop_codon:yes gene_type:complete